MKKLMLLTTALVVASGASAYAQGEHGASKHRRWMSSHAQMREAPVTIYRSFPPAMIAPPYGYYGGGYYGGGYYGGPYGGYGPMDDPDAEGRTSG
jgi:hypothetical protein